MSNIKQKVQKIYNEHLENFEPPNKLATTTKKRYKRYFNTLSNNDGTFKFPTEYAKQNNLKYRTYTHYRAAILQIVMQRILRRYNNNEIDKTEKLIKIYKQIKFDKYTPEPELEAEPDPKHLERVLRGLRNSNKQRNHKLSDDELKELAYQKVIDKQAKEKSQRNTKSRSLAGLTKNWQSQIRQHITSKYKDIIKIVEVTGCRPIEITENPVRITFNQAVITVNIKGAKISDSQKTVPGGRNKSSKGQEWREMDIDPNSDQGQMLYNLLGEQTQVEIQNTQSVEALREAYKRASKKAGFKNISIYSLRHWKGCQLKTEGFALKEVAQALGHQSTRSSQKYGHIKRGAGGSGIIATRAASKVRDKATPPPNIQNQHESRPTL